MHFHENTQLIQNHIITHALLHNIKTYMNTHSYYSILY